MSELALELVKKCLETKDPYLDLGNCGLRDEDFAEGTPLDLELRKCVQLQAFVLSNEWGDGDDKKKSVNVGDKNFLNTLPPCLFSLTTLIELVCCGETDNKWGITDTFAIFFFSIPSIARPFL